jgi:glycosyltransferase involved in cell wall biosynthesis
MSRVTVVTSTPPFAEGGHLVMARALVDALRESGHEATLTLTPQNRFGRQGAAYLANWLTDVGKDAAGRPVDQVISLRYPAYAVRHPVHVCWLNHTMREYYDLWPAFSASLSRQARIKEGLRRSLMHRTDTWLLRRLKRRFTISKTVAERMKRWNRLDAEVLYPPPPPRAYRCDAYEDYIFAVSRLTPLKRMDLIIEALAEPAAASVRCVIAGEGEHRDELERLARTRHVSDRVTFTGRLDEEQLLTHLARCRAVCFVPFQEDYGFVTVEAFSSRKAVVTCLDSGGVAELVDHEQNGLVCDPSPPGVAGALRRIMDVAYAERLGQRAAATAATMSWEAAVRRLIVV